MIANYGEIVETDNVELIIEKRTTLELRQLH